MQMWCYLACSDRQRHLLLKTLRKNLYLGQHRHSTFAGRATASLIGNHMECAAVPGSA